MRFLHERARSGRSVFHLAFNVRDLDAARRFYCGALGGAEGRSAPTWVDCDFFGHPISLHLGEPFATARTGRVGGRDHGEPPDVRRRSEQPRESDSSSAMMIRTFANGPLRIPDLEPQNDSQLVARCRQGDGAAWRLLVQRYQRLVYAVARRAGLDEHAAADVFQTVFSRLVQALPGIAQPDRLQAWIVTTAKRETWLQLRRARRTVSMTTVADGRDGDEACPPVADTADPSPLAEDVLDELQQLHLLRLAMDRLDARCHGLLTLLFADENDRLPYKEIAVKLDVPAGSIGPTRARCLNKLRTLFESGPA